MPASVGRFTSDTPLHLLRKLNRDYTLLHPMIHSLLEKIRSICAIRWRVFTAVFLVTATILTWQHREFYFQRPVEPWADFAANTLAIRNAGYGRELHGNYSRWRFNHPGPILFYLDALGERVFYRMLHVCPRPHNAHAFTSMLVQVFFWSLTLALLACYLPAGGYLIAVWFVGWIHFYATGHAFVSMWPPHTLLLPTICYLIACASVASGRIVHLWVVILSGLTLIHNHVAQPLPVGLIGLATLFSVALSYRKKTGLSLPAKGDRAAWIGFCSLLLAVLLLPLVLDIFSGKSSNFYAILEYLRTHKGEGKSATESLNYFLQFARYWGFHDLPMADLGSEIRAQPIPVLLWSVIILLGFAYVSVIRKHNPKSEYSRFLARLRILCVVAFGAAIIWGMKTTGPMFAFNGFYYYGIYLVPLICAVCAAYEYLALNCTWFRRSFFLGAAIVPWLLPVRPILSDSPLAGNLKSKISAYIADKRLDISEPIAILPNAAMGLDAVTVVNILEEDGARIAVPPSWTFLFGQRFDLVGQNNLGQPHLWAIVPSPSSIRPDALDLVGGAAGKLIPLHEKFAVQSGWTTRFEPAFAPFVSGFSVDMAGWAWSIGPEGDIVFPTFPVTADVEVTFHVGALAGPKNSLPRRMVITAGEAPPVQFSVTGPHGQQILRYRITAAQWNAQVNKLGLILFHFSFLDPITPMQCNDDSRDDRPLSVSFAEINIDLIQP